jgi:hypothetical protein
MNVRPHSARFAKVNYGWGLLALALALAGPARGADPVLVPLAGRLVAGKCL